MKIEVIRNNKKRKVIIGTVFLVCLISAVSITLTRAKYTSSQSIKIARGTVKIDNADLKVIAIKLSEDGNNYTDTNTVPTSGYTLNTNMTKCTVNGREDTSINVTYKNGSITISNVTKKGMKCNLYFDKEPSASDIILTGITPKTTTPTFTSPATGNEGVYATNDGMYGGTTYYWRGAVTNNYVTFAGFCWRIVRINGDGSIRLIYDGTTCHANGTSTSESIALNAVYNSSSKNNSYVGWTYELGSQRPNSTSPQKDGTASNAKTQLETWYKTNITNKGFDGKAAEGKFCNDRKTKNNETWRATGSEQYYAAYQRNRENMRPTTSCPSGDIYELKVGLITADEVTFAGASGTTVNKNYYLYNGQYCWTMSPACWNGWNTHALLVDADGHLSVASMENSYCLRPVINLRSDTQFQLGGNGTQNNPYVVI